MMEFVTSSPELSAAISSVMSIALAVSKLEDCAFFVRQSKKATSVLAYSADSFASIQLSVGSASGTGLYSLDPTILQGVIRGRKNLHLKFGETLEYSEPKTRYSGSFAIKEVTDDQKTIIAGFLGDVGSGIQLTAKDLAVLRTALECTNIKAVYEDMQILTYVVADNGILQVSAFENYHSSYFRAKLSTKESFKTAVKSSYFPLISKVMNADVFNMVVLDNRIDVSSDDGRIRLSLPASQVEQESYGIVAGLIADLKDAAAYSCTLDPASLLNTVSNLTVLHKGKDNIELEASKNRLKLSLSSGGGRGSDTITVSDGTGEASAKVEPTLLRDTIALLKGKSEVKFEVHPGYLLRMTTKVSPGTLTLLCVESQ